MITRIFGNSPKFFNLYNSVSYNNADMEVLKKDIYDMINTQCTQSTLCTHGTMHSISSSDVLSVIGNLKHNKKKDSVRSYNLLRWEFEYHIAMLFTALVRHGLTPDGILTGTMIPIPKCRWANLSTSDNFRAITISNILCKLLDVVILTKEKCSLCTSDLQYVFKQGSSTSLCTAMVQTIPYYVHTGSNANGLILHASKAFDCVNYCKLFRILLDKKVVPLYCTLRLNMYLN